MSANQVGIITIAFPDPEVPVEGTGVDDNIDPSLSFQYFFQNNIRTLSTNAGPDGDTAKGLLYVPDLASQECKDATADLVPANVTRKGDLPDTDYILMGLAPWTAAQPQCVLEFLASTKTVPIHGFIFYLPGNSTDIPPLVSDPVWGLGDGGAWKRENQFPVWAIPSFSGEVIMDQINLYSGNVTEVPHGHDLAGVYPPSEYIRLYGIVRVDNRNPLPSLWVFLLITLALLILIIGITSLVMHILQRRRRRDLQQRITNGEVDLEALGIKRLTVPRDNLDKMPTYKYNPDDLPTTASIAKTQPNLPSTSESTTRRLSDPHIPSQFNASFAFQQQTCPICLDDFVPLETTVRELPCHHIFHPECVDTFLLNNSSLCPMCKHSTLPRGYCPAVITNAMVRRERMARRRRERAATSPAGLSTIDGSTSPQIVQSHQLHTGPSAAMRRAFLGMRGGRRIFSAPAATTRPTETNEMSPSSVPRPHGGDIEMAVTQPNPNSNTETSTSAHNTSTTPPSGLPASELTTGQPCPPSPTQDQSRREWARQRALHLLGNRRPVVDADEEEQRRGPLRRWLGKVFPG